MLILLPAYGRTYKSTREVLVDWEANKDFIIAVQGLYINKQDVELYNAPSPIKVYFSVTDYLKDLHFQMLGAECRSVNMVSCFVK